MTPPADSSARRRGALDFLLGRINYERSVGVPYGERQYRLDRMRELLERLDRPDRALPIVHVTGTKGKGSTSAMIAAALSACKLSTGLFTSPHLERVEERIAVDGQPCSADELADLVDAVRPVVTAMDDDLARRTPPDTGPTYFELTTAMALIYFRRRRVDAAVLEVGLGGRLDSTNVCQSSVSVITSISFDHMKQLGDTLPQIAWEKAGIIKPGVPVVSGVTTPDALQVIERTADERGSRLLQIGREFDFAYRPRSATDGEFGGEIDYTLCDGREVRRLPGVRLGLCGRHQGANAAVALTVLEELRRLGWNLPESDVRRGLAELRWPARIEVVARRPLVVLDAAHNVASAEALVRTLDESFPARRRLLVFATTQEKDVAGMLRLLLPFFDRVVLTRYTQNPRGVPPEELAAIAATLPSCNWEIAAEPAEAWRRVRAAAPQPDDLICVTGSFFIAAQMRPLIADSQVD